MSETYHMLHYLWKLSQEDCLYVVGFLYDKICSLPINLLPEEQGIAALDRLYPLKPKNPI